MPADKAFLEMKRRQWAAENEAEKRLQEAIDAETRALATSTTDGLPPGRKVVRWWLGAPATVSYWLAGWSRLCVIGDYELRGQMTNQLVDDRENLRAWLRKNWELAPENLREWIRGRDWTPPIVMYEDVLEEVSR